jgi:large subunit ribosomal protein L9
MKVLLQEDISNVGYAGEVCEVAAGYGRNYLIPRGMAVLATKGVLKQAERWREKQAARRESLRAEYRALTDRLTGLILNFEARAGESGKLYGSVTTNEIADRINKELGLEIDRRAVVGDPLRQLGEHMVSVRLSGEYQPQITVVIHPETSDEPEEAGAVEEVEETPTDEYDEGDDFYEEDEFDDEDDFDDEDESEAELPESV